MNDIAEKQNREAYLMLQYAARYYYNRAEILNYVVWIICIIGTVVFNLNINFSDIVKAIVTFIIAFLTNSLPTIIRKYVDIASALRKYIDYHLFGFKLPSAYGNFTENGLLRMANNIKEKHKKKALEQFANSGTDFPRGVRDWYTGIDPNSTRLSATLACQEQNAWWDRKLSNIYIGIMTVILIGLIVVAIMIFINDTIMNFICFLVLCINLIVKAIREYIIISKYKKLSISLSTLIETPPNVITVKYLIDIQNLIDKRRNMLFISSNLIHNLMSGKLHKLVNVEGKDI